MKRILIYVWAIFTIGLIILVYFFMRPHFWIVSTDARVYRDSELITSARVYKSVDDDILVRIGSMENEEKFIYFKSRYRIGIPTAGQFIFLPFSAFSKSIVPAAVLDGESIKLEKDMELLVQENTIRFRNLDGRQIKVILE